MLEDVLGCKWTLRVLGCIRAGTFRPGAIEARLAGLTTKVLNERLRKLVRFGILQRTAYPEVPPRVEYRLTSLGVGSCACSISSMSCRPSSSAPPDTPAPKE